MKQKRGQMKLSFGMIFSIFLIIIFVSFSFFAIKKFVGVGNSAQIAKFRNDLQSDVDKLWKGSQGSQEQEYFLPSKIKYVCFIDYSLGAEGQYRDFYNELQLSFYGGDENLFFYPLGSSEGLDSTEIKHINLEEMTRDENPFCIRNTKGKLKITLKKNYGDASVTING